MKKSINESLAKLENNGLFKVVKYYNQNSFLAAVIFSHSLPLRKKHINEEMTKNKI